MATASMGVGIQPYTPMKLPSFKEAHIEVMTVNLDSTNAILPSLLCVDPIFPLADTLAIFKATLDSLYIALKNNE